METQLTPEIYENRHSGFLPSQFFYLRKISTIHLAGRTEIHVGKGNQEPF